MKIGPCRPTEDQLREFGGLFDGEWWRFPDGSKGKFVPYSGFTAFVADLSALGRGLLVFGQSARPALKQSASDHQRHFNRAPTGPEQLARDHHRHCDRALGPALALHL